MDASRHLAVTIAAPADDVYAWARDPRNLARWAAGLARTPVREEDGAWVADSPMGRVTVAFAPPNPWRVLDHDVTLPSGEVVTNPMRVLANDAGADVVFTVRRRPDMSAEQFDHDCGLVLADLETLRGILESG